MELCSNGQLIDIIRALPMPPTCDEVLQVFYQTCKAIQHMHKQKPPIAHRDLKVSVLPLLRRKKDRRICIFFHVKRIWNGHLCDVGILYSMRIPLLLYWSYLWSHNCLFQPVEVPSHLVRRTVFGKRTLICFCLFSLFCAVRKSSY